MTFPPLLLLSPLVLVIICMLFYSNGFPIKNSQGLGIALARKTEIAIEVTYFFEHCTFFFKASSWRAQRYQEGTGSDRLVASCSNVRT